MEYAAASVQELIFHSLHDSQGTVEDNCNVFRADLFSLFPNLVEVEWWTDSTYYRYPFNPKSLLSMLNEASFSQSFCRIRLRDYLQQWMEAAFAAVLDIEQQVGALDFVMEQYTVKEKRADVYWIELKRNE